MCDCFASQGQFAREGQAFAATSGVPPYSTRVWRARTPRSIAVAISGSSCNSVRTNSSMSNEADFEPWSPAMTSQASA